MVCVDSVLQLHIVKVVAMIINRCFFIFLCLMSKDKRCEVLRRLSFVLRRLSFVLCLLSFIIRPAKPPQNMDSLLRQTLDAHVLLHLDRLLAMCL